MVQKIEEHSGQTTQTDPATRREKSLPEDGDGVRPGRGLGRGGGKGRRDGTGGGRGRGGGGCGGRRGQVG